MIRQPVLAILLTLGLTGSAAAMDLPPQVYAPETTIDGVGQGWYLRGDLGYTGWTSNDAPSYSYVTGAGPTYGNESFDDSRFGKHMSYGAGMGYQFNEFLRSDATLDFFSSDMTGSSNIASPCAVSEVAGTSCGFTHSGDFKAIGALANLYADLGTYAGITPYVGGGAGVTHVSWSDITTNTYCVNGSASCSGDTYNSGTNAGLDSWRFTYALMAGLSYDITSNMKLDFGYRFSKIAGGDMFDYSAASKALGATGAQATDEGLSRHEIRAGIRINTW